LLSSLLTILHKDGRCENTHGQIRSGSYGIFPGCSATWQVSIFIPIHFVELALQPNASFSLGKDTAWTGFEYSVTFFTFMNVALNLVAGAMELNRYILFITSPVLWLPPALCKN